LNYQWQKEGADLADDGRVTGATTPTLTVANASAADEGLYRCAIESPFGSAVSNEVALKLWRFIGDMNGDEEVDGADLVILKACICGAGVPVEATPQCLYADVDHDGDADLSDFGLLQQCLTDGDAPLVPWCLE